MIDAFGVDRPDLISKGDLSELRRQQSEDAHAASRALLVGSGVAGANAARRGVQNVGAWRRITRSGEAERKARVAGDHAASREAEAARHNAYSDAKVSRARGRRSAVIAGGLAAGSLGAEALAGHRKHQSEQVAKATLKQVVEGPVVATQQATAAARRKIRGQWNQISKSTAGPMLIGNQISKADAQGSTESILGMEHARGEHEGKSFRRCPKCSAGSTGVTRAALLAAKR